MNNIDTEQEVMPQMIQMSYTAVDKVLELIEQEGVENLKLRVFVQGGGCSGFQYGFTFDEKANDDDFILSQKSDKGSIELLVDSMSAAYLHGANIDYTDDINGAQFVIKNPNTTTTCGCGSSFAV